MAWYKYPEHLKKSNGDAYDKEYKPGATPDHSGIYCAKVVVAKSLRNNLANCLHKTITNTPLRKAIFVGI